MKLLDESLLAALSAKASNSSRLRQHCTLSDSNDEPCQRLLNAIEPGSYVRPHRHLTFPRIESLIGIRGCLALFFFDDEGTVKKIVPMGPAEAVAGVEVHPEDWHTVVSLKPGSVFYEAKPGPFNPGHASDMAPWAPEEGSPEATKYLEALRAMILTRDEECCVYCAASR